MNLQQIDSTVNDTVKLEVTALLTVGKGCSICLFHQRMSKARAVSPNCTFPLLWLAGRKLGPSLHTVRIDRTPRLLTREVVLCSWCRITYTSNAKLAEALAEESVRNARLTVLGLITLQL